MRVLYATKYQYIAETFINILCFHGWVKSKFPECVMQMGKSKPVFTSPSSYKLSDINIWQCSFSCHGSSMVVVRLQL